MENKKTENERMLIEALLTASAWEHQLTDREKSIPHYSARVSVIVRIFEKYKDKIIKL